MLLYNYVIIIACDGHAGLGILSFLSLLLLLLHMNPLTGPGMLPLHVALLLHHPTGSALLINFLLSSDAGIFAAKHRLGMQVGAKMREDERATRTCSD